MENFKAGANAIAAGIALVIVLYISYIAIPLIILCLVMFGVYLFSSIKNEAVYTTESSGINIVW